MAGKCMKMQNSCQWKWVLNSRLLHFQLSKFSLILQDTERTYCLVPKHHSLSLQYNRTSSLIRPKCRACWKTGNIQDVVREGENLPCSLRGLVLLLQSQRLGAEDYLVRKGRELHSPIGETSSGEGWNYKSYGRRYTSGERQNWEWCKEARSRWMSLGSFGGGGIACRNKPVRLHQVQHNLVLITEAKHMFSSFFSPKIIPMHFLFHQRNPISVAFSHPLQGKISWSNPNRKQRHAMVAHLLPASEIATFAQHVSDPPKHRQSSSVTCTHTFVHLAFANNLWCGASEAALWKSISL